MELHTFLKIKVMVLRLKVHVVWYRNKFAKNTTGLNQKFALQRAKVLL